MRNVSLYRDEDGYWIAECSSLPGCVSQGDTEEEALANIKEAIELYIESLAAHGDQKLPYVESKDGTIGIFSGPTDVAGLLKT
jgi:predicted RNase H-like HicB family nuclease